MERMEVDEESPQSEPKAGAIEVDRSSIASSLTDAPRDMYFSN